MIKIKFLIVCCFVLSAFVLYVQKIEFTMNNLKAINTFMSIEKVDGEEIVKVVKDLDIKEIDEPTLVKITDLNFTNRTIEVKVLSRLLSNAPDYSQGFIGIAFHINEANSIYESVYIRPTNGRADDQVRRNHSIQYFAYPDFKFPRLRKESPEQNES